MEHNIKNMTDRRVLRTRKAIYTAFAQLLSEKDVEMITVKELAALADINRKTFYNYYDSIAQLVDEMENEIVERFSKRLETEDFLSAVENPTRIYEKLYEAVIKNLDLYGPLLKMKGNTMLTDKVVNSLVERSRDAVISRFNIDQAEAEIMVRFLITGEMAVYANWLNQEGGSMTLQELSEIVSRIFTHTVNALLGSRRKV